MRLRVVGLTPRVLFARKGFCASLLHLLKNEQGHGGEGLFLVIAAIGAAIGAVIGVIRNASLGWIMSLVGAMIGGVIGGVLALVIFIIYSPSPSPLDVKFLLGLLLVYGILGGGVIGCIIGFMSAIMVMPFLRK